MPCTSERSLQIWPHCCRFVLFVRKPYCVGEAFYVVFYPPPEVCLPNTVISGLGFASVLAAPHLLMGLKLLLHLTDHHFCST